MNLATITVADLHALTLAVGDVRRADAQDREDAEKVV